MKVHTLITAIALDDEDVELTRKCYDSFMVCKTSYVNDVMVDTRLHPKEQALTGKWNEFINFYRGKDYDYLMICANDTLAHPDALEFMVRVMEDNPDVGIMHPVMNRDKGDFDKSCRFPEVIAEWNSPVPGYDIKFSGIRMEYTSELFFSPHETANMILRKGVIETVGEFDLLFPHERNEQDYFLRASKLGIRLATSPMKLFYHPPHSQDDPNRQGLIVADKNWQQKWGATWFAALEGSGFRTPYNQDLPLTYTIQDEKK